jgi:hypothetical protein
MELDQYTRKLAAILFTDMVGYTAVMQKDELKAILMQKKHQFTVDTCKTIWRRSKKRYGRWQYERIAQCI